MKSIVVMVNIHNLNGFLNRVFMRSKPFSDELYSKGELKMSLNSATSKPQGTPVSQELMQIIDRCIDISTAVREYAYRTHLPESVKKATGGSGVAVGEEKAMSFSDAARARLLYLQSILKETETALSEFVV